jgi:hypothetical protein
VVSLSRFACVPMASMGCAERAAYIAVIFRKLLHGSVLGGPVRP